MNSTSLADSLDESYAKQILKRLILSAIMVHKLPWKYESEEQKGKHFIIRDAWGKPFITSLSKDEVEDIILLGQDAFERQKNLFPNAYKSILHLWKTIEEEDQKTSIALEKEDENDFRNMPLRS